MWYNFSMRMPSRQTLAKLIFISFILIFATVVALYLYNPFSTQNTGENNFLEGEKRGSIWAPFGNIFSSEQAEEENTRPVTEEETETGNEAEEAPVPRLRQISSRPTAGAIFYLDEKEIKETDEDLAFETKEDELEALKKNTIRYVSKENGHIYETYSNTLKEVRVSNTTIPKIGEAHFTGPLTVIYRYLGDSDEIKTFSAEIIDNPNGTEGKKLQGIFLEDDILDLGVNIAGDILYARKTDTGSEFIKTNYLGEEKTRVFSSPLSEYRIDFEGKGKDVLLSIIPSSEAFGQVSRLNTENASLRTVFSGQKALSGLANSNMTKIAITSKVAGRHVLKIIDSETGDVFDTGLETFTDKCTWSLDNTKLYCGVPENQISESAPDTWYQGIDSYTDSLWVINARTRSFEVLVSPLELIDERIDMTDVNLSTDEQFIHFINKKDLTLWSYKLN